MDATGMTSVVNIHLKISQELKLTKIKGTHTPNWRISKINYSNKAEILVL